MEVPDHIYIDGRSRDSRTSYVRPSREHRNSYVDEMHVPDRITVGKGGVLITHTSQPNEVLRDLASSPPIIDTVAPPPTTLTATHLPGDDAQSTQQQATPAQSAFQQPDAASSSLAVESDPLGELKKVRRLMGRLTTRVAELEDENERRTVRDYKVWAIVAGSVALLAFLLGRR